MSKRSTGNLYDPRKGDQAVCLQSLRLDGQQHQPARTNYFAIYWIESGSGVFWADASRFDFGPDSLLFFVPYQRIRFVPAGPVRGEVIQFHANFLCVETFHAEVGCSGVLFNDPYGIPVVRLVEHARTEVAHLIERLRQEQSFGDELYFSRLFKKATGYSPTFFRDYETEIRGGSNLSMFSGQAPILHPTQATDN